MLNRKIDAFLAEWTVRSKKKSLIIEGTRLVGKTTSVQKFINRHYEDKFSIYLSFKANPNLVRLFNRNLEVSRLYQELRIRFPNKVFEAGKTIIFFDDIQLCPVMISYLKSFTDDGLYDIIAAGSSMGVIYKKNPFPIGYVERYTMEPLDFEEYLWANGFDKERLDYLEELYHKHDVKISASHDVLLDLFREYMVIGGNPLVVSEYLKEHNFKLAFELQHNVLDSYYREVETHSNKITARKVKETLESIPRQLMKQNKKFQYKVISNKARAASHKVAVEWLLDANMVLKSTNLEQPTQPFSEYIRNDTYKLYLHDPGLLVCLLGEDVQLKILRGEVLAQNGAVVENVIGTILHSCGFNLYYYENNSTIDVDFLVIRNRLVTPILLKEADNPKSKVMKVMKDKFHVDHGLKLTQEQTVIDDKIETIPLYMSIFLER